MKKIMVLAISVLLVCSVGNSANAANELLNSGFEIYTGTGTSADFANWNEGGTSVATSPAGIHSGAAGVFISQSGGSLFQNFALPAGDTLDFGAYFKIQTISPTGTTINPLVGNWDQVQISMQITGDGGTTIGGSITNLSTILNNPNLWTDTDAGPAYNWWTDWILISGTLDISGIGATTAGININLQNDSNADPALRSNFFVDDAYAGVTPVPEPGTLMLLGSGLVGLAGYGRRRFRK